jgi:hypothetical protein
VSLLDEAIEAAGGLKAWSGVSEISAHVRSGGFLMRSKLKGGHFTDYGLSVATGRQSAIFQPYPRPSSTGVFEQGDVRILNQGGQVSAERENAREAFFGLSGLAKKAWWNDLDALYFAGYAMGNYLNSPFLLAGEGFESAEVEGIKVKGEQWRRLDVRFPDRLHTHCREQSFYFGPDGLLRRHDFTIDVIGGATGMLYATDYRNVDGIIIPTTRRGYAWQGDYQLIPEPLLVAIDMGAITIH